MRRSAVRATLVSAALLLVCGCDRAPEPGAASEKAQAAWKLYLDRPAADTFKNFIHANAEAVHAHGDAPDRVGIEYQLRALEVEAAEAERAADADLADQVTTRIDEIERHDLVGVYDETLSGAKERLAQAKARAARLLSR